MGGSIDEHVWRQSYKMSTSQVTFGANLIKCQLLMSTSTVILARILQSVNFSISIHIGQYQYCGLLRYWQYQYIHSSSIVLPNMGWGRINSRPYQNRRFSFGVRKFVFAVNLGLGAHEVCTRSSFEEEGEEERERRKEREREGRRDQKKESARM